MRWHGWIASWVVMVAVALAAAGSCWAEGEVVAPPAPGPGVEDQYDELLGNILGPMAGAPAAGVSNPLGSADGGPAAPGAQLSAEEWARRLVGNPQEGADTYGAVLASWLQRNPEALKALLEGEGQALDEATLLRLLEGLPLGNPGGEPMLAIPKVYKAICAPLCQAHGEDLAFYKTLTPRARLVMTAYLGTLGKGEAMKSLLSSLTPTEREALATPAGFVVGDTLEAERSRDLLPLMIWAWKDEATRHGGDYPIMICYHLVMACRGLTERTALGEQVMPWVEDALGKRDGGRDRDWAIASLVEGYRFLGDHAKAIERGEYWLAQGAPRSVGALGLHRSEYCVALALEDRESGRAAQLLRRVAENGTPGTANLAQLELIRLRLAHPELTGVQIITPRLDDISVWNAESVATRRIGVPVQEAVLVRGNVTLLVTGASCDLPDSSVSIGEKVRADGTGYLREVLVSAPGFDKVGVHQGTLAVSTNDPERREVTLTLRYAVTEPVGVAPSRLFFGYVTVGECKRCSVRIAGTVPFEVTGVSSELAENLEVKLARTGDTHWLLESTLRAGVQTGVVEGAIELETTLKSQPVIKVRYYAFIRR